MYGYVSVLVCVSEIKETHLQKQSRGPRSKRAAFGQRRPRIFLGKHICFAVLGRWNTQLAGLPSKKQKIPDLEIEVISVCVCRQGGGLWGVGCVGVWGVYGLRPCPGIAMPW